MVTTRNKNKRKFEKFRHAARKKNMKENLIFSRRRFMPLEPKLHSANIGLESKRRIDDSDAERKCSENPYECIVEREVNMNQERCRIDGEQKSPYNVYDWLLSFSDAYSVHQTEGDNRKIDKISMLEEEKHKCAVYQNVHCTVYCEKRIVQCSTRCVY